MEDPKKGKGTDKPVVWSDRPPPRVGGPSFLVVYAQWGKPVAGYALGEHVRGVELHWLGQRSFPCFKQDCPLEHATNPARWYGYLAFWVPGGRLPTVLGVSESAFGPLDALEGQYGGLRGLKLKLARSTPGRRSRVLVELLNPERAGGLPPAFPVEPLLLRLWGLDPAMPPEEIRGEGEIVTVDDIKRLRLIAEGVFLHNGHVEGGAM